MKEKYLEQLSFSQHLTEAQRQRLADSARIERFRSGDLVYSPARECLGLIFVIQGVLRTCLVSENGKRATIFRLRSQDVCVLSMSCLLSAITFDVEVEAEQECELFIIPSVVFERVSRENIYLENFSYRVVTERFSNIIEALEQLMFMSLEQRVVTFLLDESAASRSDTLFVTQEKLAENIGSAREAVTRILKQLKEKGLISLGRGKIELLSRKELYAHI